MEFGAMLQAMAGSLMTLVMFGLVGIGVHRLYKLGDDLNELKDVVKDIRRNLDAERVVRGQAPPLNYDIDIHDRRFDEVENQA
jgi:hypothetical protein